MSVFDSTAQAEFLLSLSRHQRKYGLRLLTVVAPHSGHCGEVDLYPAARCLAELAAWIQTLRGTSAVITKLGVDGANPEIAVTGALMDGTAVTVTTTVWGHDYDLLAVNTPVAQGADVPVDLLLSLVDAATAEQTPAMVGTVVSA
jgi:hypothetical protein